MVQFFNYFLMSTHLKGSETKFSDFRLFSQISFLLAPEYPIGVITYIKNFLISPCR
jgi:hypothetical protein